MANTTTRERNGDQYSDVACWNWIARKKTQTKKDQNSPFDIQLLISLQTGTCSHCAEIQRYNNNKTNNNNYHYYYYYYY